MTVINKQLRRDVIPRWRASSSRTDLDSYPAVGQRIELEAGPQQDPIELLRQFELTGKPMFASEALSVALTVRNMSVAKRAAAFLKRVDLNSHPALAEQVASLLDCDGENYPLTPNAPEVIPRNQIKKNKQILRSYPKNPLAWLDLAFAYSSIGQMDHAKKAVFAAISLEKNSRGIVRAASRFFVHNGEFDLALSVISRSSLLNEDPWLVSAHIATARAGGRSSMFLSMGRKMFKSSYFRPDQLSELGAALATNEVEYGNEKLARKIIDKAVLDPSENAVAQIGWLEAMSGFDYKASNIAANLPNAWEARTFDAFERSDWRRSCDEAKQWLCDQPFSSRPSIHGSYVASTFLEDYRLALWFAKLGYTANPSDVVVANNYSVTLAEMGRVADARKVFSEINPGSDRDRKWMLQATEGLLAYREGRVDAGRAAYERAREYFARTNDIRSNLLSRIYQVREERRLGNVDDARHLIRPFLDEPEVGGAFDFDGLKQVARRLGDAVN